MAHILVVDDEETQTEILKAVLTSQGHQVATAGSSREALKKVAETAFDLVITDQKMPGQDGLSLLANLKREWPQLGVVVMTGHGSIEAAVEAMKLGALDYLQKPFGSKELALTVDKATEKLALIRENIRLRQELTDKFSIVNIVGRHGRIQEVLKLIHKVAPTQATVLIRGESGTGKELVARAIHSLSPRRYKPFIPVNCAAIPNSLMESELFGYEEGAFTGARHRKLGLFELADTGTLFFDEICELDLGLQAKVLRALQERAFLRLGGTKEVRVDVRIIAATNQNVEERMAQGRFREDLYYRLNVFSFLLPTLRDRKTDIPELVTHFLARFSHSLRKRFTSVSPEVLDMLMDYHWPGNVRQLESVIERAVILCEGESLLPEDLPLEVKGKVPSLGRLKFEFPPEGVRFEDVERELLTSAYHKAGGVISKAASLLGMNYYAFYRRWERLKGNSSLLQIGKPPLQNSKERAPGR